MTDFGLTKEFQWQRDIMQKLDVPYVVIIGNHDCLGTGVSSYEKIFGALISRSSPPVSSSCALNTNSMEFDSFRASARLHVSGDRGEIRFRSLRALCSVCI